MIRGNFFAFTKTKTSIVSAKTTKTLSTITNFYLKLFGDDCSIILLSECKTDANIFAICRGPNESNSI